MKIFSICNFCKKRLPKLKSAFSQRPLSQNIEDLLNQSGLNVQPQEIIKLAETTEKNILEGYHQIITIDQSLGGVGLHNVNRQEGELLTGSYKIEFRPLFRPIQYVYAWISFGDLFWNARRIVLDSCLHIENSVKYRFNIPESDRSSLGILLNHRAFIGSTLEPSFLDFLNMLNWIVYRKSKHSVEHILPDAHCYTPADALAIYFICRWAGVKLLETTGIFNHWEE